MKLTKKDKQEIKYHIKFVLLGLMTLLGVGGGLALTFQGLVFEHNFTFFLIGFVMTIVGLFGVPLLLALVEEQKKDSYY